MAFSSLATPSSSRFSKFLMKKWNNKLDTLIIISYALRIDSHYVLRASFLLVWRNTEHWFVWLWFLVFYLAFCFSVDANAVGICLCEKFYHSPFYASFEVLASEGLALFAKVGDVKLKLGAKFMAQFFLFKTIARAFLVKEFAYDFYFPCGIFVSSHLVV